MGRSPCCEKPHTNRGAWTKEEDQLLISYITAYGEGCWRSLPKAAGLQRCGKSCRLRWINYLQPDLKRGNFTEEEDELIIKLHGIIGNNWFVFTDGRSSRGIYLGGPTMRSRTTGTHASSASSSPKGSTPRLTCLSTVAQITLHSLVTGGEPCQWQLHHSPTIDRE